MPARRATVGNLAASVLYRPMGDRPDAVPGRTETVFAYATSALAALVWVGCVAPAIRVDGIGREDDALTPMARGALLLLPALLVLVAGPVASLLSRGGAAHRTLLACGDAFVAAWTAGALWATAAHGRTTILAVSLLTILAGFAVRDAVLGLGAGGESDDVDAPAPLPRYGDMRLALSLLALLTPASLLVGGEERASLLGPFGYVVVSALGSRFSHDDRGLRLTASILHALVAAHLVVALRYVIAEVPPEPRSWTWPGYVTISLAGAAFLAAIARAVAVLAHRPAAPAPAGVAA